MNLAIAFGSRGKGAALAHYEPSRKVINLTKLRGAGCLAHELGHAIDNYLYRLCGLYGDGDLQGCYLSLKCTNRSSQVTGNPDIDEIIMAMYEVVGTMKRDSNGYRTKYMEAASKLDAGRSKKYYSYVVEMFARAFESYIEDKLFEKGMVSQYLVHSTRSNAAYGTLEPYPTGVERAKINKSIDNLIKVVKSKVGDKGFQASSAYIKDKSNYVSYQDSVIVTNKKTKESVHQENKKYFNTVEDFDNKIKVMNEKLRVNEIDSGNTPMDKVNFWTDLAQKQGLMGRIGLTSIAKPEGISKMYQCKNGAIGVDRRGTPIKILEGAIEATMHSVTKNTSIEGKDESLLANTMTIIVLHKEGIDVGEYLKKKGYKTLIGSNSLAYEHLKMAYHLISTLVK
jgi:hypothetical protein